MINVPQLFCELQRDWARKKTAPAFMNLLIETSGTAGIQFSCELQRVSRRTRPQAGARINRSRRARLAGRSGRRG